MNIKNNKQKYFLVSLLMVGTYFFAHTAVFAANKAKPTSTSIEFKLFPSNYFTDYDVSASLTGSDSRGINLTGNIVEKLLPRTAFLGTRASPIQTTTEFFAMGMGFGTAIVTSYYSTNVNARRFLGVSGDITTVKATTTDIPVRAKIGQSGIIGTYIDKRKFTSTLSWQLEDGFNGQAKLIFLNTTNKPSGDLDNTFKTTYLIQENGKRESVELETYNDTIKITVTLKGRY